MMTPYTPNADHRLQGRHNAIVSYLEEIAVTSHRFKELHGDSPVRVRGDSRLHERQQHLSVSGERIIRIVRRLPLFSVRRGGWRKTECCPTFSSSYGKYVR